MKLINVAPVKAGDKIKSVWTAWQWVTVTKVRSTYGNADWVIETEDEGWFYWINDRHWRVQKNETAQCSSGQAGAEV